MHLVFATNNFYPKLGGSVQFTDRLSLELLNQGHEVTILTKTAGSDGFSSADEWTATRGKGAGVSICRFSGFQESVRVMKTADAVVCVEMSIQWLLRATTARTAFLATHHTNLAPSSDYSKEAAPPIPLYRIIQQRISRHLPSVACSGFIAEQWGPHVTVLPNPYDPEVFYDRNSDRNIDFLFAGRFGPEKGLLQFVEALAGVRKIHQDFKFAIAGGGPLHQQVTEALKTHQLQEHVMFFGEATPDELAALYARTKFVVVPSVWKEPFGLIPLEALASGADVICSDQPGLREASGGLARYVPTGDVCALSSAMIDSLVQPPVGKTPIPLQRHLQTYRVENSVRVLLAKIRALQTK